MCVLSLSWLTLCGLDSFVQENLPVHMIITLVSLRRITPAVGFSLITDMVTLVHVIWMLRFNSFV